MTTAGTIGSVDDARRALGEIGQEHVLAFWDELSADQRDRLLAQIAALDLDAIPRLAREYVLSKPEPGSVDALEPHPYFPHSGEGWDPGAMRETGEELIRAGKVAAFVVAGGQGSRLGYDGPKGEFPATPVSDKPLFRVFAEWIAACRDRYGCAIPWYVMTSPINHDRTADFFDRHDYFGLPREDVMFFAQGVLPSFGMTDGKLLLAAKGVIATNPDGHGGSLKALWSSGAIDDMRRRGVEHISYFQVDNPSVRAIDPVFLGLHAAGPGSSAEMSSKVLEKAEPREKVGVIGSLHGKTTVIEYSDLSDEHARARDPDGRLRYRLGSIAIHSISVAFVARLNGDGSGGGFGLPLHRAEKKVPHVDIDTGDPVEPDEPNAVKLETFVFDALPFAKGSVVYETDRVEEFAPIKNAEGADSPASSRLLQTERAARWLEAAGVDVPRTTEGEPDCSIEIAPSTAMGPDDLRGLDDLPARVERGGRLVI